MLEGVFSVGQTKAPIDKAFRAGAGAVVLVPIKTVWDEISAERRCQGAGEGKTPKLYCITLGQTAISAELKRSRRTRRGRTRTCR